MKNILNIILITVLTSFILQSCGTSRGVGDDGLTEEEEQQKQDLDEIEVGVHGLMLRKGFHSGLFLPQVPGEQGWNKKDYLEHLCLKAGLDTGAYKEPDAIIHRFSAEVFSEKELGLSQ